MRPILLAFLVAGWFVTPAFAQPAPFPKGFRTQEIATNGVTLHVRVGGSGPAVVLLHGYGETPGAMHAGFAQFAAFDQDAVDNRAFLARGPRLKMPMLAVGGEKSFGTMQAFIMRFTADDVTEAVIPDSGHWLMEEQPAATVDAVHSFLDTPHGNKCVSSGA